MSTKNYKLTPEQQEWLDSRPQVIKDMFAIAPANHNYSIKGLDEEYAYYTPYSYHEDGTMTVTKIYIGFSLPPINVFGVKPEDLVRIDD